MKRQVLRGNRTGILAVNGKSTTPTQASGYVVLIRWLQSALIPFITTQSVAEDGGY